MIIPHLGESDRPERSGAPAVAWLSDGSKAALAVCLYGLFLMLTNPFVTVFEDEANFVASARRSVAATVGLFSSGPGDFAHPPLFDIFLHFWLRLTGESFALLRLPSIFLYCLALWFTADVAELLWRKRWTALAVGIAWPAGYFLSRPAGWYALSMLELAALTLCYFRWRQSGRPTQLVGLTVWALLLVYTNYFGWVFIAVLGADLLFTRAGGRALAQFLTVAGIVALLFAPLGRLLVLKANTQIRPETALATIAQGLYLTHSLVASEMAAPWTWPGAMALAAEAGLLWLGWRKKECRRLLLWLLFPLAIGLSQPGIFTGLRICLLGPWLLLLLTAVVGLEHRRTAAVLVAVAFGSGWLGVVTGRYMGTHRYTEPWREVVEQVIKVSQPGDMIVCVHPSFFFYASYRLPWGAARTVPAGLVPARGRLFVPLLGWQEGVEQMPARVIYVRTTVMWRDAWVEQGLLDYLGRNLRLIQDLKFDRDRSAALKQRWFPNASQPEWRIEVETWGR